MIVDYEQYRESIASFSAAIDTCDRYECESTKVASCIVVQLKLLGYDEPTAYAAANMAITNIHDEFIKSYYASSTMESKYIALSAAVRTAIEAIKEGIVTEEIKNKVREILDEES